MFNTTLLTEPVELAYEEHGSGDPLVLLHGFPLNRHIWDAQVRVLSADYRVITPDLRGLGESPAPEGAYSMGLMAADVINLLDKLGVRQAAWAGHSMGGYVQMAAYRLSPERFSKFGLISSNHLPDSAEARQKRMDLAAKVAEDGSKAALNPKLFAAITDDQAPYVQLADEMILNNPPAGIIGCLQAMAERPDSTETLKTIEIPAIVLAGAGDQLFPIERAHQMDELLPQSTVIIANESGHMPMFEQTDVTTDALRSLMATSF